VVVDMERDGIRVCVCVCALSHVVLVLHQQPLNYDGKSVDEMISYHIR